MSEVDVEEDIDLQAMLGDSDDSHILCCRKQNVSLCGKNRTGSERTLADVPIMCAKCVAVDTARPQCMYDICVTGSDDE